MKGLKKRQIMTIAALMLLTATLTYCITVYWSQNQYNDLLEDLNMRQQEYAKIDEVHDYITKYYVSECDEKDLIDGALYGMVETLDDKWSYYLTAEQFSSVLNSDGNNVVSIGINPSYDEENAAILILDVYEGTPAEYAKLRRYDRIVKVDGEDVSQIGYDAAVKKITGSVDTAVSITVIREGVIDPINLSITRRAIDMVGVRSKILDGNIGYIKISNFGVNVDKDFRTALGNLMTANVSAIIFDVRNNSGGLLNVMVNTVDPLLPEGVIIREEDKFGSVKEYSSDAEEINIPMAVLVNEHTTIEAEFFAAALQEAGKAIVVGEKTAGKGLTQSQIQLTDGSGIILSVGKYYTGKGVSLDVTGGVSPDIVVELTEGEKKIFDSLTESQDRQFLEAVAIINEKLTPPADPEAESGADTQQQ